jgi:hypothetical protein
MTVTVLGTFIDATRCVGALALGGLFGLAAWFLRPLWWRGKR